FARLLEANGRRLVPYHVIFAQVVDEDQHEKGIAHGIQRPAKMCAHIILVPEIQRHLDLNGADVVRDMLDPDACAQERRINVKKPLKSFAFCFGRWRHALVPGSVSSAAGNHATLGTLYFSLLACIWPSTGLEWFMCTIRHLPSVFWQRAVPRAART